MKCVLISGWGFSAHVWEALIHALLQQYPQGTFCAYALPTSLCEEEKLYKELEQSDIWIAWSLGGHILLSAIFQRGLAPKRGMVLCASTPKFIAAEEWLGIDSNFFSNFLEECIDFPEQASRRFIRLVVQGSPRPLVILSALQNYLQCFQEASLSWLNSLYAYDFRANLCHIQFPVIWIQGARDQLVPMQTAQSIAALMPSSQVTMLKDQGHALPLTALSYCEQAIASLLG